MGVKENKETETRRGALSSREWLLEMGHSSIDVI